MILVVDDHDAVRKSAVRLLASQGYQAVAVAGGREALHFLQTHAPGLVVVDLHMPDLDGLDVLRAVRADERIAGVPVVMLTASPDDHDGRGAAAASLGVQDWIVKASVGWTERLLEAAERYARDGRAAAPDSPAPPS
jgi:CheY-like chemotaxis protein